jgi:hypothetical protein
MEIHVISEFSKLLFLIFLLANDEKFIILKIIKVYIWLQYPMATMLHWGDNSTNIMRNRNRKSQSLLAYQAAYIYIYIYIHTHTSSISYIIYSYVAFVFFVFIWSIADVPLRLAPNEWYAVFIWLSSDNTDVFFVKFNATKCMSGY